MQRILLLASILSLASCSWLFGDSGTFRDRKNDYLNEKTLPPLQVPTELNQYEQDELFLIPPITNKNLPDDDFDVPRPAPLLNAGGGNIVRIQKLGSDRWLLIDVPPSHLWQRVKNFLLENKIPVSSESASNGLLETGWLKRAKDANEEVKGKKKRKDTLKMTERYQYRIDQGVQRNSSEVHILHYAQPLSAELLRVIDWPQQSSDDAREEWMVRELSQYLADGENATSVSLLAQGIESASKVSLTRDALGQHLIVLELPFDRAWASVGQALKKADFNVLDMNRSEGRYFTRYEPKKGDDKKGFFASLFGDDDDEQLLNYQFDVIRIEQKAEQELEQVIEKQKPGIEIRIHTDEQTNLEGPQVRKVLERLKGFLS